MFRRIVIAIVLVFCLTGGGLEAVRTSVAKSFGRSGSDQLIGKAENLQASDGFDYPISNVYRPTRTFGDGDGWYVSNAFGNNLQSPPCTAHYHPGDDWNKDDGLDSGQPVRAASNGTVVSIRNLTNAAGTYLGQGIALSHLLNDGSTVYSVYVHVVVSSSLLVGSTVNRGDMIASIYSLSSGPHLHFETRTSFNPNDWYPGDDGCGYYSTYDAIIARGFIDPVAFIDAHRSLQSCNNGTSNLINIDGGPPIHPAGSVVKSPSLATVYLLDPEGRKRPITSSAVLAQLYNQSTDARTSTNFSNWVITVSQSELDMYEDGGNISAALPSNGKPFPDGKLIGYNGEISIVTDVGRRRPFTDGSRFTGLGYSFCNVVNVSLTEYNSYPVGPPVDAMPALTNSININPLGPYISGQSINGTFAIRNVGFVPFSFVSLGAGGRLNGTTIYDMNFVSTTLAAGSTYVYSSNPLQLTSTGSYNFYAAYQDSNGNWTTFVPALAGVTRSRTISVASASPPASPTASQASSVTSSSFTANWSTSSGATGYRLDVATDSSFTSYVSGYQNLDVANTTSRSVSGLNPGTTYYYRVRSYNSVGTSGSSNTISVSTIANTVQVTIQSSPVGRSIIVDGASYTAPQMFTWQSGSAHTVNVNSPQSGGPGVQYAWSSWSDGGAISHNVAPTSNTTITATFTTQYQLTTSANPSNGGNVNPSSGNWYNAGSSATLQASPNPSYSFSGWTGSGSCSYSGSNNPVTITMNCAATQTANFTQNSIAVTVNTNPSGRSFSVDGVTYTSSQVFNWTPGSQHTISTTSPQSGGTGIQYLFGNWSDGGAITHQVAPTSNTTYTANFTTQYQLTTAVSPSGGGMVTPSSGGWYNAGAQVSLQAFPNSGYTFAGWTGAGACAYSGPSNPATISMNCPVTETATFSQSPISVTVNTSPAGRSFNVDGTNYTGTQTFSWNPSSAHTISTTSPQSGGPGIQYIFTGWSDGGQISHTVTPTSSTTYTANFSTQYFLTMNPGTGGSVSPASGWRDAGQSVQISAASNSGYTFSGWTGTGTGAYSGSANPASITMGGPITETASFNQTQIATIQFSSPTFSVNENGSFASITVTRSTNVGVASVFYSTSNGTATAGSDYAPASPGSSVNFDFGMTTALITIPIYDDTLVEGSETFNLTLSNPSPGYSVGSPGTATVTIIDNDSSNPRRASFDFDGDGKTDVSVYRPGAAAEWWIWKSSNNGLIYKQFGSTGDLPVPADYTGDGKTDIAVFRPSTNTWNILRSEDDTISPTQFGTSGDIPAPADFDGDGKADPAIFRGSTGTWWFSSSANGGQHRAIQFGQAGDKPVPADYDGDGTADFAIYRPNGLTGGEWWILRSTAGVLAVSFGSANDKTVVGDYTGDGKADCAFFRPSNGIWYVLRSDDFSFYGFPWGLSTDQPVPGDYDGDGKTDAAVFRQPGAQWYVNRSTGGVTSLSFGTTGDVPIPGVYVR